MFNRLQQKWKVGGLQLLLIICTFALGGSLTGYLGKKIMNSLPAMPDWLWAIVYILLITIIWPLGVLLISIPLGQFPFFRNYIAKIGAKLGLGKNPKMTKKTSFLAIFASGTGSNAQKIVDFFRNHPAIKIALIVTNNPRAGVLELAKQEDIPVLLLDKQHFTDGTHYLEQFRKLDIRLLVLAGFLWKLPPAIIRAFPGRIINIHPALLPDFGGQGMYGRHVHEAVLAAGRKESGITIHYADEIYDHGEIIFQARCPVNPGDSPATLAARIRELEHAHYPRVIEKLLKEA